MGNQQGANGKTGGQPVLTAFRLSLPNSLCREWNRMDMRGDALFGAIGG